VVGRRLSFPSKHQVVVFFSSDPSTSIPASSPSDFSDLVSDFSVFSSSVVSGALSEAVVAFSGVLGSVDSSFLISAGCLGELDSDLFPPAALGGVLGC